MILMRTSKTRKAAKPPIRPIWTFPPPGAPLAMSGRYLRIPERLSAWAMDQ